MRQKLNQIFEGLDPSPSQIQSIGEKITKKTRDLEHKQEEKNMKKHLITPWLGFASCLLVTTVAWQAMERKMNEEFPSVMVIPSEHKSQGFTLNKMTYTTAADYAPIDLCMEHESGTIHLTEMVGDSNTTILHFDFYPPEGVELSKNYYVFDEIGVDFSRIYEVLEDVSPYGSPVMRRDTGVFRNEGENKLSFTVYFEADFSLDKVEIPILCKDLRGFDSPEHYQNVYDKIRTDIDSDALDNVEAFLGEWSADMYARVDYVSPVEYEINESFTLDEVEIEVGTLCISPYAVYLTADIVSNLATLQWSEKELPDDMRQFTLCFEDGSTGSVSLLAVNYIWGEIVIKETTQRLDLSKPVVSIVYMGQEFLLDEYPVIGQTHE